VNYHYVYRREAETSAACDSVILPWQSRGNRAMSEILKQWFEKMDPTVVAGEGAPGDKLREASSHC
jgi:hypothetical protein